MPEKPETFKQMLDGMIRNARHFYNLTGEINDLNNLNDLIELRKLYNKENRRKQA